jgi:hypothetical protein
LYANIFSIYYEVTHSIAMCAARAEMLASTGAVDAIGDPYRPEIWEM